MVHLQKVLKSTRKRERYSFENEVARFMDSAFCVIQVLAYFA